MNKPTKRAIYLFATCLGIAIMEPWWAWPLCLVLSWMMITHWKNTFEPIDK